MALKIMSTLAEAIGLKKPEAKPEAVQTATETVPPWQDPQPVQSIAGPVKKSNLKIAQGLDIPKGCSHVWNPQTNKCIRCGLHRPGFPEVDLSKPVTKAKATLPPPLSAKAAKSLSDSPQAQSQMLPVPSDIPDSSILHAIRELAGGRKGTLMLVSVKTGEGFKVESTYDVHDPNQMHIMLTGAHGFTFKPRVGFREVPLYSAVWRE